jgi:hypothetical protein
LFEVIFENVSKTVIHTITTRLFFFTKEVLQLLDPKLSVISGRDKQISMLGMILLVI